MFNLLKNAKNIPHLNAKPRNYWADIKNQREFFDLLSSKLSIVHITQYPVYIKDITHLDDWYSFYGRNLKSIILKSHGGAILNHHNGSIINGTHFRSLSNYSALRALYPEHKWMEHKFQKPHNYWADSKNQRAFLDNVAAKLRIPTSLDPSLGSRSITFETGIQCMDRACRRLFCHWEAKDCSINTMAPF